MVAVLHTYLVAGRQSVWQCAGLKEQCLAGANMLQKLLQLNAGAAQSVLHCSGLDCLKQLAICRF